MKRFAMALALTSVLSVSALAGDVPSGGFAPPPDGTTETTSVTSPGNIPTGGSADQTRASARLMAVLMLVNLLTV